MQGALYSVPVIGYGLWDAENPRYGEFVRLGTPDANVRWSLDKDINGARPEPGTAVDVGFVIRFKPKPSQDGSRAFMAPSYRVVAIAPAEQRAAA